MLRKNLIAVFLKKKPENSDSELFTRFQEKRYGVSYDPTLYLCDLKGNPTPMTQAQADAETAKYFAEKQ